MSFLTHCCSRCCCCLVWMDSSMYESLKSTGFQCQSVSVCRRYCLLWVCTAVTLEITTIFSYCCYCFCQLSSECLSCLTACSLLPCSAVILVNQLKCQPTGAHCRPNCYRFDRTDSPALPINRSNEEESGDKASRSALVCVCVCLMVYYFFFGQPVLPLFICCSSVCSSAAGVTADEWSSFM